MKTISKNALIAGLCVFALACSNTNLVLVLDTAVVASTAAITACSALPNQQACLDYADTVNADAEESIPIASDPNLNASQVATKLIPIWLNVSTITFPNAGPQIVALQAAVAAVIQIIELYNSKAGTPAGNQHLKLSQADLQNVRAKADTNRKKIAVMRH